VTCSGITAQTDTLLTAFTTPESCLLAGKCWQPRFGSTIRTEQSLSKSASQTMGCFSGVAGTSIGQKLIPASNLIPADRMFYLTDETGRILTRSVTDDVVRIGTNDPTLLMTTSEWSLGEGRQLCGDGTYFIADFDLSCVPAWPVDWPFVFFNDLNTGKRFAIHNWGDLKGLSTPFIVGRLTSPALNNDRLNGASPFLPLILPSGKTVLATKNFYGALCYLTYDYTINTATCATSIPLATKWTINILSEQLIKSQIRNNFCVDVNGASHANGATLIAHDCHVGDNQRWTYNPQQQSLRVKHSGKCLDIPGGNGFAGQTVWQWDCLNNVAQKWIYNSIDKSIRWAGNTDLCLDVSGGSNQNGAPLLLWHCHGGISQIWTFGSSGTSTPPPPPATPPPTTYCGHCTAPGAAALFVGQTLRSGTDWTVGSSSIRASTGTQVCAQTDGKICIKTNGLAREVWCSNTWQSAANTYTLTMQNDGNLVSKNSGGSVIWQSNSARANNNYCALLQTDNNWVIYDPGCTAIWANNRF